MFCDETIKNNQIDLISEVETCVYEINVLSSAVCKIPHFSKKSNDFDIKCNPVLPADEYQKYVKKQDQLRTQMALNKARLAYKKWEKEQEQKQAENADKKREDEAISIPVSLHEKEAVLGELDEEKQKVISMHSEITAELGKTEKTFSDLTENAKKFKTALSKIDAIGNNEESKEYLNEAQKILTEQVDDFLKTDEVFDKLTTQLNRLIDDLSLDELEGDGLDMAKDFETSGQILGEKIENVLKKSEAELLEESELNEQNQANADDLKEKDSIDEDEKVKSLEDKLVEQLSKSNKYADKFKNGDIKIKIISFKTNLNEIQGGLAQDDDLKNLLAG